MSKHLHVIDATAIRRRAFLRDLGLGFGSVALAALWHRDAAAATASPAALTHFAPKAKSVIWLFMIGGASHLESFDPKPALNRYAGKTISETPFQDVLKSPYLDNERVVAFDPNNGFVRKTCYPLQVGFQRHGESGLEISDWWPHLSECADDLCLIRSMWTEDSNHGAQLQFHTGRHRVDGFFPTIGSWVSYGLGSLNENLPEFVVLGTPLADCCGGREAHRANYLGPQYDGVPLKVDPRNSMPYLAPEQGTFVEEQRQQFALLRQLNQFTSGNNPDDEAIQARIRAYELVAVMQSSVPQAVDLSKETAATKKLYGADDPSTQGFERNCLLARRLLEHGVRFVQLYNGGAFGAPRINWDAHEDVLSNHRKQAAVMDKPVAGLLKDLKQRGLLKDTLVLWTTEFGRTPFTQGIGATGRDHHQHVYTNWMAGAGLKPGFGYGQSDEVGYKPAADPVTVYDFHATVLHLLGLDHKQLTFYHNGIRRRLTNVAGVVIDDLLA